MYSIRKRNKRKKCEYNSCDYDYIILKFTINFLKYVPEKSNCFIYVLLEQISTHYHFSDFEKKLHYYN